MTDVLVVTPETIQNQIYTIRSKQVIMDRDLAVLEYENCDYKPLVKSWMKSETLNENVLQMCEKYMNLCK